MIKNYQLLKETEFAIETARHLTPKEALNVMSDMYEFAMKFRRYEAQDEISPHVNTLINLTATFKRIGERI